MKPITILSRFGNYDVHIENNLLDRLSEFFDSNQKYVIVFDDNIPQIYVNKVRKACPNACEIPFPQGEKSKCLSEYQRIIEILIQKNIHKDATLIALGGGVTGDLGGFVAATYLRGISYVQIPTTLLAQIDSSVGGKVAIDFYETKNSIGSIYPPKQVLIDPTVLQTLEIRHFQNGMAELIKYGMIADEDLFESIRSGKALSSMETTIAKAIQIKKAFVEKDELDMNIRHALNFGHTYGHAIEAYYRYEKYLHGEAIAIGMVKILPAGTIKTRLMNLLKKYSLPTEDPVANESLNPFLVRDKKSQSDYIRIVTIPEIGKYAIQSVPLESLWK